MKKTNNNSNLRLLLATNVQEALEIRSLNMFLIATKAIMAKKNTIRSMLSPNFHES